MHRFNSNMEKQTAIEIFKALMFSKQDFPIFIKWLYLFWNHIFLSKSLISFLEVNDDINF